MSDELRTAAFFDLDKTLIEGSSGLHFARVAYRNGMIGRREMLGDIWANVRFRMHGSTDAASEELRVRFFAAIAGTRVRDMRRLGAEAIAGILPRLYTEVLSEAHDHQDAGRLIFIVTAAPHDMAEMLAHVLGLDSGIGTRSQVRDGVYTGEPDGPFTYRSGKARAIAMIARERGIDLSRSFAYSDSESDLPMLELVGNPVAVNPDAALARVARQRGWRIMRFDKLGRRLRLSAAAGAVALAGWGGGYLAGQLRAGWRPSRLLGRGR